MWAIVGMQRSGTHLLGSLLSSHPELTCYGEVLHIDSPPFVPVGDSDGIIAMYNQIIERNAHWLLEDARIIHLTRDLEDNARSWAVRVRREGLPAHSHDEPIVIDLPEISQAEIDRRKEEILEYRREAMKNLSGFEVSYEYLCGGEEISELSKEKATPLLEFLGVEPRKLTTELRKDRYENSS